MEFRTISQIQFKIGFYFVAKKHFRQSCNITIWKTAHDDLFKYFEITGKILVEINTNMCVVSVVVSWFFFENKSYFEHFKNSEGILKNFQILQNIQHI